MIDNIEHNRGLDFFNPEDHSTRGAVLVGAGGIGSFSALGLSKLFGPKGPSLTIVDPDTVEKHNVPNQLFAHTQVGLKKVQALEGLCNLFGGVTPNIVDGPIQSHPDELTDIVITALDSMEARKWVWDQVQKQETIVNRLIDARLLGQYITVYSIDPSNEDAVKYYSSPSVMFTDDEAEEAVCTARAIIDVGMIVGGHVTTAVRQAMTGTAAWHTLIHNVATGAVTTASELGSRQMSAVQP